MGNPETNVKDQEREKRIKTLNDLIRKIDVEQESNPKFKTIGEFYAEIMDELWDLADLEKYLNEHEERV